MTTTTNTTARDIARKLRADRKRLGLTQAQVAGLAGCSLTMLTNIERGAMPRRSPTLARIQAALAEVAKSGHA